MKKIYVLILGIAYLLACTATVKAEFALQESKDFSENVKSVEEREHAVTHVFRVPASHHSKGVKTAFEWDCNLLPASYKYIRPVLSVPIFLLHCNFRR
jgi:hypothetical protein